MFDKITRFDEKLAGLTPPPVRDIARLIDIFRQGVLVAYDRAAIA